MHGPADCVGRPLPSERAPASALSIAAVMADSAWECSAAELSSELADGGGAYQEPAATQGHPATLRDPLSGDGVDYFNNLATEGAPHLM